MASDGQEEHFRYFHASLQDFGRISAAAFTAFLEHMTLGRVLTGEICETKLQSQECDIIEQECDLLLAACLLQAMDFCALRVHLCQTS